MSSRREAAAADAAGRSGCNGEGQPGKALKKRKVETWAPRMSSQREAAAADAAGRRGILGIYTIAHMGGYPNLWPTYKYRY